MPEQRSSPRQTLANWMLFAAVQLAVNSATLASSIGPLTMYGASLALAIGPMAVSSGNLLEGEGGQSGLDYDQLINIFYEGGEGEETFYAAGEQDGEKVGREEEEEGEENFAPTSLSTPPSTSFSCAGRTPGAYYADPEAGCQLFHRFLEKRNFLP